MVSWEAPHHPNRESVSTKGLPRAEGPVRHLTVALVGRGQVKARTIAPVHHSRPRICLMYFKIFSESIGGSPGPQLDAADGQPEPIVHDLHQSLVELLERPDILSLHAVRRVGC